VATEISNLMITLPAAGDLSTHQFKGIACDNTGKAALAGAGVAIVGVLQNKPSAANQAATIMAEGVTPGVAGAAVAAGASVEMDANGLFITLAAGVRVGIALQQATLANQVISILLTR
jgi:hypothetical protein